MENTFVEPNRGTTGPVTVDPRIIEMAEKFSSKIYPVTAGDPNRSIRYTADEYLFEDSLDGTGITVDMVKRIHDHMDLYYAALGLTLGNKLIDDLASEHPTNPKRLALKLHTDVAHRRVLTTIRSQEDADAEPLHWDLVTKVSYMPSHNSPVYADLRKGLSIKIAKVREVRKP